MFKPQYWILASYIILVVQESCYCWQSKSFSDWLYSGWSNCTIQDNRNLKGSKVHWSWDWRTRQFCCTRNIMTTTHSVVEPPPRGELPLKFEMRGITTESVSGNDYQGNELRPRDLKIISTSTSYSLVDEVASYLPLCTTCAYQTLLIICHT